MTEQQTAADALVEKLEARSDGEAYGGRTVFAQELHEAAERIKSLQAEVERLNAERDIAASWARGERNQAKADRQRMRDALEPFAKAAELAHNNHVTAFVYVADLHRARDAYANRGEAGAYTGAGDLDAGTPNYFDHTKRGFQP